MFAVIMAAAPAQVFRRPAPPGDGAASPGVVLSDPMKP
jgi:hypothetical protein